MRDRIRLCCIAPLTKKALVARYKALEVLRMLYNGYEMQRTLLAGASALANMSAEWLQNPINPFRIMGYLLLLRQVLRFLRMHLPRAASQFSG